MKQKYLSMLLQVSRSYDYSFMTNNITVGLRGIDGITDYCGLTDIIIRSLNKVLTTGILAQSLVAVAAVLIYTVDSKLVS
jgi:hypothetical protein